MNFLLAKSFLLERNINIVMSADTEYTTARALYAREKWCLEHIERCI